VRPAVQRKGRIALVGGVLVLAGCNLTYPDEQTRFFELARQEVREDPPSPRDGDTVELRGSRTCEMVDELALDGVPLELVGSATAGLGQAATRYVCSWTGEAAEVSLEIVLVSTDADYATYAAEVLARPGAIEVDTGVGTVHVAPAVGEADGASTAVLVDEDERGGIELTVTPTDPDLAATWTPEDTAAVLEDLLE
jgi:hypothetical protein